MNITMIKKKDIKGLKKSEMKNLSITKISHENGVHCVEFFNKDGAHRVFSKNTDKAIKKALKNMRKTKAA
jgi:hypothetical protein